jgi:outer membrane protein insertion porin family
VSEGPVYLLGDIKFGGDLIVSERELRELLGMRTGDTFSREKIIDSVKRITDRLGNDGYSFANVNPVPDLDREKRIASFTLFVDPGRRVYVRRVNIVGNSRSQDAVIRRELRQLESSWYSLEKIARSKERLQRTGYYSDVNIETPSVAGTADQVDVTVTVTEKNTGSLNFGVGYSQADKLTISASVSQANIFGSGNQLAFQVNSGSVNKIYSLSYLNPYWTVDGVAAGIDIFRRDVDTSSLSVTSYQTASRGIGANFGLPITEYDSVRLGFTVERTELSLDPLTSPARYLDFVNVFGSVTDTFRTNIGYARDTRDSLIYPTRGWYSEVGVEVGMPPGDLKYYRASLQQQYLYTPERPGWLTLLVNGELGYANGYGGLPLPFFKNFYAGGVGSVRGFEAASLGPRDLNGDVLGGNRRVIGNLEFLFPMPGIKDKSVRLSTFIDAGWVWGPNQQVQFSDIRAATGIAVGWDSPVGPLKFSYGFPIRTMEFDKVERFQFQLGKIF